MSTVQLNAIKVGQFSQFDTMSEFLLGELYILYCHLLREGTVKAWLPMHISNCNWRGSPYCKTSCSCRHGCSSSMINLSEYLASFAMNGVSYFLPSISLLLVEKTGCSWETLSSLWPGSGLSQHHSTSYSLRIVLE